MEVTVFLKKAVSYMIMNDESQTNENGKIFLPFSVLRNRPRHGELHFAMSAGWII